MCTNTLLVSASGSVPLAADDFHINGNLESARLTTSIPVFDSVAARSFNVSVDLTWGNPGTLTRDKTNSHFQTPGFTVNSFYHSSFRFTGATGVISDGIANYTGGIESLAAALQIVQTGTVEITH
jgi:hypothetical protein